MAKPKTKEEFLKSSTFALWDSYTTKKMECEELTEQLSRIAGLIQDYEEGEINAGEYMSQLSVEFHKLDLEKLGLA